MIVNLVFNLYRNSGELISSTDERATQQEIIRYNQPFTKLLSISDSTYESGSTEKTITSQITIYDVVSTINYAKDINNNLDYPSESEKNQYGNPNYIIVNIELRNRAYLNIYNSEKQNKIEDATKYDQKTFNIWLKECGSWNFSFSIDSYNANGKVNKV
ncbi:MAG: hypothetical protein IJW26_06735, partial [Clostridia bacterium]|nr:hypothetical protein [Clostridia bacterium]